MTILQDIYKDALKSVKRTTRVILAAATGDKLTQAKLSDDSLIEFQGETVTKGSVVKAEDASGELTVLPDGVYKLAKDAGTFTITDGTVSEVELTNTTEKDITEPIEQAQSKTIVQAADDSASGSTSGTTEPVQQDAVITPTVDINDLIAQAISPMWEALTAVQASIQGLADMINIQQQFKKDAETKFSKIEATVTELADEPAAKPVELSSNPFNVPNDIKESRGYKRIKALENN